jgi:hypothetical protein
MGQIIGFVVVFSLSLAVLLPVIIYSQDKIIGTTQSVADIAAQSNLRASQNIVPTLIYSDGATVQIYISNTGMADVTVLEVLVDGIPITYTFEDQQRNPIYTIAPKQLAMLDIAGVGTTVQIISQSGKLFEMSI